MSNPVYFTLASLLAVALIVLAMVYPQGLGAKSPKPFGHPLAPLVVPKPPPPPHVARDAL